MCILFHKLITILKYILSLHEEQQHAYMEISNPCRFCMKTTSFSFLRLFCFYFYFFSLSLPFIKTTLHFFFFSFLLTLVCFFFLQIILLTLVIIVSRHPIYSLLISWVVLKAIWTWKGSCRINMIYLRVKISQQIIYNWFGN